MGGFGNIARAFSSRNYRIYVTGNSISLTGTWLQRLAVGWLAWQLSHSGAWLGLVSFADLFPTVVLSPWAGALADRHFTERRVFHKFDAVAGIDGPLGVPLAAFKFAHGGPSIEHPPH